MKQLTEAEYQRASEEYHDLGYERGANIASWNPDATIEELFECEDVNRQFSPFEFTAHELNSYHEFDSEGLWTAFDDGIADAFSQFRIERHKANEQWEEQGDGSFLEV